ncbi:thioredoxin domain-containing protein 6 isoform X8 [Equus przewalskii]|uniref:Thioredoxin domain-containing protein 6 isoform X8 n=1 Tax=Equus przewalskii TaxID=9798 RepID=A0ABM4KVR1_EQUPR
MGSKKKEIALQVNISTQELWEEMLSSKGLTVVDVYQGWCGPCKPVVSLFQKMRIEVGLDLLHFALAEADCLDVLERYRGRCEPTFLFYAGGELVAVVRGANAPLLQRTILDQLEAEKKVLAEGRERRVIKDEALSDEDEHSSHEKDDGEDEDVVSALSMAQKCPSMRSMEARTEKTPAENWHCSSPVLSFQMKCWKPLGGCCEDGRRRGRGSQPGAWGLVSAPQMLPFSSFFHSWSLTRVLGPLFAVPSALTPHFIICEVVRCPFPVSLWMVCGTEDWDRAVFQKSYRTSVIPQATGPKERVVGPTRLRCPEHVDGQGRD